MTGIDTVKYSLSPFWILPFGPDAPVALGTKIFQSGHVEVSRSISHATAAGALM